MTNKDDYKARYCLDDEFYADYELIEQLGKGGVGEVFLARQKGLDRPVAIKFLSRKFAAD